MSLPTHDEPWLREELDRLLADEPDMRATVQDDVRRGQRARAVRRRRRTVAVTVSALVVAVAVPVGLMLRPPSEDATPADRSDSALGHVWTPEEGYVADGDFADHVAALIPAPVVVTKVDPIFSLTTGCPAGTASDGGCAQPSHGAALTLADGGATGDVSVVETVQAIPDISASPCNALQPSLGTASCVVSRPWTKAGGAWTASIRSLTKVDSCREIVVVRRGRTAVTVTETLSTASCRGSSAEAAPLTSAQLTTLALAAPLVQQLASFIDVSIYGPGLTATPQPSGTVPVRALWSPSDGYVGQDEFVARVRHAMPEDVTTELVAPSGVREVPCGFLRSCGGGGYGSAYRPDPDAPKPLMAAFNVTRGDATGLLVLGEDTTSGNETAALRTCLGYAGCTQLRPWTQVGDAWTAVFENVHAATGLVDRTAYVVRGSSAFGASVQTQVLRADDVLQTLAGATPVLEPDELLALAMTLPLGDYDGELIRHGKDIEHQPGLSSYDGVRTCTAADLTLSLDITDIAAATAFDIGLPMQVRAGTRHSITCVLSGVPGIRFSGGDAAELTVVPGSGGGKVLMSPSSGAVAPVTRGRCASGGGTGPVSALVYAPDGGQAGTKAVDHDPTLRRALAPCATGGAAADTITTGPFSVADGADWPGPL